MMIECVCVASGSKYRLLFTVYITFVLIFERCFLKHTYILKKLPTLLICNRSSSKIKCTFTCILYYLVQKTQKVVKRIYILIKPLDHHHTLLILGTHCDFNLVILTEEQISDSLQCGHGEEEIRPQFGGQVVGDGRLGELGHGGSVGAGAALGPAQIDEIPI